MLEKYKNFSLLTTVSKTNLTKNKIQKPLSDLVKQALQNYFFQINNENVNDLYKLVLSEVEKPLLDIVMEYAKGNQTKAALILSINRGTLRKKLKKYGIIE
ncbi:MAG: DNA-binding transcriptional regulator Fis [Arsenophonus sp.]|nr:MAG: DNA-binding transcriptional regulator Fis [Arsenophonus sp.]